MLVRHVVEPVAIWHRTSLSRSRFLDVLPVDSARLLSRLVQYPFDGLLGRPAR